MVAERKYVQIDCPTCNGHGVIQFEEEQSAERRQVQQVLVDVAVEHGVTIGDLIGPSRAYVTAQARQEVMYRLRLMGLPLKTIGWHLGGRDHSTVHHGVNIHIERHGLAPLPRNGG